MQVQPGDPDAFLPQQSQNPGKLPVFIAEATAASLFRALGLAGAHLFNVKIDPDPNGSPLLGKLLQPVDLPQSMFTTQPFSIASRKVSFDLIGPL